MEPNTTTGITYNDWLIVPTDISQEQYETDLLKRQMLHLQGITEQPTIAWQPCLHDQCPECVGTGVKKDGSPCVHYISCPCPKCSPR